MATTPRKTDLSVTWIEDGREKHVLAVGDTSRLTLAFDVESPQPELDGTPASVAAVVTNADNGDVVTDDIVEVAELDETTALVTVSGFTRGASYELEFTTTYTLGRRDPRTFALKAES